LIDSAGWHNNIDLLCFDGYLNYVDKDGILTDKTTICKILILQIRV